MNSSSTGESYPKTVYFNKKYHPLYSCYMNMVYRCTNQNHILWEWYGGRGIRVCAEWLVGYAPGTGAAEGFEAFFDWALAAGWNEGLDINRIDNDGNYEPNNCQFVTHRVNMRNRRNTKFVTYRGIECTLPDLLDELVTRATHISRDVIRERILSGWAEEDWLQPKYYHRSKF